MEDLTPGSLIDERYIVEAEIGRGGMAVVYRVRHAQLGTLAALKLLTMPATSIQKRLMHEGRVQAALQHPNIVSVSDVVVHNNAPGLVMEYVRGPSLDDFLINRRPTVEQADELADGILKGVAAAHAHGLIHRDLKPANIMLSITDTGLIPKVTDFGLVKVLEGDTSMSKTRSGVAMGTPSYMAPEQISDAKNVDVRADIFSLGAILYELLSSHRTFDHEDMFQVFTRIMNADFKPIQEFVPGIPDRMAHAIEGALVVDRDERIPDVKRLLAVWRGEQRADGTQLKEGSAEALWSNDFLEEISSMGAGGETTAESLRRSLKGDLPTQNQRRVKSPDHQTAETVYPNQGAAERPQTDPTTAQTQHTMAPVVGSEQTLPPSSQGRGAFVPESTPPVESAPPAAEPSATKKGPPILPLVFGGGLLFFLAVGGAAGAALMLKGDPTPTAAPVPVTADPLPTPDPDVPDPTPVAPDPAPVAPDPTPVAPDPAPVAPDPAPVAPEPDPVPAPVVPDPAPPVPEPAPVVEPVAPEPTAPEPAPAADPPFVSISSGGATVRFLDAHNTSVVPSKLSAGTWKVVAIFEPLGPVVPIETIELKDGDIVQVTCSAPRQLCKIKRR